MRPSRRDVFVAAAVALCGAGGRAAFEIAPGLMAAAGGQQVQASSEDLGFVLPSGYIQQRNGDVVILAPATVDDRTPCVYGLAGRRPTTGNLEADAEAALLNLVVPGWRRLDDRYAAMRGTSAAGWSYVWYRAAFEGDLGGQRQAVNAMAMVLPAGRDQVHVVWGMGNIAKCLLDDVSFEELFHGLRPPGWRSDGGQTLTRAVLGTWRFTAGAGLQQLTFKADGRYERGLGTSTHIGVTEQTSATATGGRYTIREGELVLTPDHRPASPDRYYVRVFEEWIPGRWKSSMALFDSRAKPPLVVRYYRLEP
jgi:hypothetical protein